MAALLLAATFGGCGGGGATKPSGIVAGEVTFQGTPVTEGTVNFTSPKTGVAATAELDPDGSFTLQEPLEVGSYDIVITPPPIKTAPMPNQPPPAPKDYANIPAKYRAAATSTLKVEVEEGENSFQLEMQQ